MPSFRGDMFVHIIIVNISFDAEPRDPSGSSGLSSSLLLFGYDPRSVL